MRILWYMRHRTPTSGPVDQAIGYVRVSTVEQGDSGAGLEAQRRAIAAYCEARGWTLVRVEQGVTSGASTNGRHGLADALAAIRRGEAGTLIVAKLDRLSRSVGDFAAMLTDARREGWNLAVLDLGVDLSTPMGEAMAGMASVFAQFERRVIGERTRAALAVKRSQGVRLGRPRLINAPLRRRIHRLRAEGRTMQAIADKLNAEGVPTVGGGRWQPSTIDRVLKAEVAQAAQPPAVAGGMPRAGSLAARQAALDAFMRAEHDRKLLATSRPQ